MTKTELRYKTMEQHISQAIVSLKLSADLSEKGDDRAARIAKHMAIGHLAQASDIIVPVDKTLANQIRTERLLL